MFLAGSYSYGCPRPDSDVDLLVLGAVPRGRQMIVVGETTFDCAFVSIAALPTLINDPNQFGLVEMIALGDPLYLSAAAVDAVRATCARHAAGLPAVNAAERARISAAVKTRCKHAGNEEHDEQTRDFLIALAVQVLCEAELRLRGIWRDRPSSYFRLVGCADPSLARTLRCALDRGTDVAGRLNALRCAADRVLSPRESKTYVNCDGQRNVAT
jgi:hypothetical protein